MHSNMLLITCLIAGTLSFAAAAWAHGSLSTDDFVRKVLVANEFEIESSRLALDRSQNKNIKSFADRMVSDHTQAGEKLKDVLQSSHAKIIPDEKLDDKHQKLMEKLEAASGDDFNSQYISMQTDAHQEAVHLLSDYLEHGKDKALKQFAADTLPTLKDHLQHVSHLSAVH